MSTPEDRPDRTDEHDDAIEEAAPRPGSGKQFSKDVHSPGGDPATRGSGRQFSPTTESAEDEDDDTSPGSGKQFSPGHHDQ